MADAPIVSEAELALRREANAKASDEALKMAEEHRQRDAAQGNVTGEAAILMNVVPSLKDKLLNEQFSDPATLRPREQDSADLG